jgi:hypothetical protein
MLHGCLILIVVQNGWKRAGMDAGGLGPIFSISASLVARRHPVSVASPSTNRKQFSFGRLAGVSEIQAFGFGKAASGRHYPTLYLAGTIDRDPGIFRSTDEART